MRHWLGISANAALNLGWIQFINHANYKIIYSNVMDWANATKIHTPPICQMLFPPLTSMRCTKEISRPGMANYRKSLLTWRPLLKSANLSKSLLKLCNASDDFHKEIQNICHWDLVSTKYVKLGHFTLLFGRERQRNVQDLTMHVHSQDLQPGRGSVLVVFLERPYVNPPSFSDL